jgi:hypothetical protein
MVSVGGGNRGSESIRVGIWSGRARFTPLDRVDRLKVGPRIDSDRPDRFRVGKYSKVNRPDRFENEMGPDLSSQAGNEAGSKLFAIL